LQKIAVGASIALRAINPEYGESSVVYVVGGTVQWSIDNDPDTVLEDSRWITQETDTGAEPIRTSITILQFEPTVFWSWVDGEFQDKTEQVRSIPPAVGPSIEEPREPPDCSVFYEEAEQFILGAPEGRGAPNGETYHALLEVGTIEEVIWGNYVDHEQLVPDSLEPL
jgi:hypothetical protein